MLKTVVRYITGFSEYFVDYGGLREIIIHYFIIPRVKQEHVVINMEC